MSEKRPLFLVFQCVPQDSGPKKAISAHFRILGQFSTPLYSNSLFDAILTEVCEGLCIKFIHML